MLYGKDLHWLRRITKLPFVQGVAAFQIGSLFQTLIAFVASVVYARMLGRTQFGELAVVSAFVGLAGIVTAYGQSTVTSTFFAEAMGKKDLRMAASVLRYCVRISLFANCLYVLIFLLAPQLALLSQGDAMIGHYGRLLLLNAMLQFPAALTAMVLQLKKRIPTIAAIDNIRDGLQLTLSTVFILLGWGLWGMLLGILLTTAMMLPFLIRIYVIHARDLGLPSFAELFRMGKIENFRMYVREGLWIGVDQTVGKNLYPNLFFILLNATTAVETVGSFRLAFRLATLPASLIMPSISRMTAFSIPKIAAQDRANLRGALKKVLVVSLGLSTLITLGCAIVLPALIPAVYGQSYASSILPLLILLPMNIIGSVHVVSLPLLRIARRVWVNIISNLLGVVLSLGAYWFLKDHLAPMAAMAIAFNLFHMSTLLLFVDLYFQRRKEGS